MFCRPWRIFIFFAVVAMIVSHGTALAGPRLENQQSEARLEIDRLEFSGVSVFDQVAIEGTLEIGVGDRLERIKVVRTVENLQSIYRIRGYDKTEVRSEFLRTRGESGILENVLRFTVKEGKPTRIASVKFLPNLLPGEVMPKNWLEMEPVLSSLMGISIGEVLDQDRLAKGKRAIQDFLAGEEYVGAKVDDVRLSVVAAPSGVRVDADHWVGLEFRLDLGDRVIFGFRGNAVFTKGELNALVEEQRLIGFGKDYVGAIRSRIEDEYKVRGYANVRIVPLTFERRDQQERHITYDIKEGFRVYIGIVDFDGNIIFSSDELRRQFFWSASPLMQRGYFVNKDVEKAAEHLVEWIRSQGYLSAKLVTIGRLPIEGKNAVRLVVYLYEGDQTIVRKIKLAGVKAFSPEQVNQALGIEQDVPLNLFAFNEGIEAFKSAYRAKGYLGMSILNEGKDNVIKYLDENRKAEIELEVDEGPRYRVSAIEVEGLSRTNEDIVRRELRFSIEDVLDESVLNVSEARLRKLGIFSSVRLRLFDDETRPGYKIVRVLLEEGTPGVIAGGFGYRNDLGIRVFGQTAYTNLWQTNHTLSLGANINRRFDQAFCANIDKSGVGHGGPCFLEYRFELGYFWPWFVLGETVFRPRVEVERTQFRSFDASTISMAPSWERRLLSQVNLTGALTYSLEQTRQFNAIAALDDQRLLIGSIIPSLRLDLRDNSLAPTSGLYATSSFELAHPNLLSQGGDFPIAYTRFQWRTDGFIPLWRNITWYLSVRSGMERNLVATPADISPEDQLARRFAIPLIKQFSLGGAGSLRGFGEQRVNKADLAIRGTLSYVNYRTQVDFPFAGALKFGPFFDAANLLVDSFSFGNMQYLSAGVGFHYLSPVGPVNFDWGFNLDPQAAEPYQFHFSIGVI